MGAETRQYVNALMLEFRDLVLGLQEEQQVLKQKLRDIPALGVAAPTSSSSSSTPPTTTTSSLTSSTTTAFTAAPTASPIDDPSSNTLSSGTTFSSNTLNTASTRPPPYKSVVRVITSETSVPQVPTRTRRRSLAAKRENRNSNNNILSARNHNINMASSGLTGRGALIVLEGLDRVGKSTLAKQLVEHLGKSRRQVSYHRFPDRTTPTGKLISEYLTNYSKKLDDHSLHLLFSANRWELNKTLRDTINEGTTVVLDRYSYSGIAYSSAKKTLSMDWCIETEKGLPKPDLVIYLELSKEAQLNREGFGDERFETQELQELVRFQYEKLINMSKDNWLRIAVENKSVEQVLSEIIIPVRRCLEACANKELGDLDFH